MLTKIHGVFNKANWIFWGCRTLKKTWIQGRSRPRLSFIIQKKKKRNWTIKLIGLNMYGV